jgi:hypothetical protein
VEFAISRDIKIANQLENPESSKKQHFVTSMIYSCNNGVPNFKSKNNILYPEM